MKEQKKLIWGIVLNLLIFVLVTFSTVSMMTTVFFLAPTSSSGFLSLFMNSNFFYHFFVPVLCFISYVWFENDCQFTLPFTFTGIIPMGLYSIFYISTILIHLENGVVAKGTDWYGFLFMGFNTIYIVIPLILGITYLFAFGTWAISKKVASKQK